MFERELRDLAFVPRWGIVRTVRQQNVAEHSFFVAIYADQIAELASWKGDRAALLRHALAHDWDEILTSDIAAPAKRVMKKAAGAKWDAFCLWLLKLMRERYDDYDRWMIHEQNNEIEEIVKIADILEAVMYLAEEENLGNKNVATRREYLWGALHEAVKKSKVISEHARYPILQRMESAMKNQQLGQSKLVTGEEMRIPE